MKRFATTTAMMLALGLGHPAPAQVADPGAYLAARTAVNASDYTAAIPFLAQALSNDPDNAGLLDAAVGALIGAGDIAAARPLADRLLALGGQSQIGAMVHAVGAAQDGNWRLLLQDLEAGRSVGPLADGLTRAWAYVGQGEMTAALSAFDEVIETRGMLPYGLYHKALALALVGDFEAAEAILSLPPEQGMQPTRRALMARAQVLSQLGQNAAALAAIEVAFPATRDPVLLALTTRLSAGETVPFTLTADALGGLAETYYSMAASVEDSDDQETVLILSRIAEGFDPTHVEAILLSGRMLEQLGQFALANAAYARVPADHPGYVLAEMGRADVLRRAGNVDAAVEVLRALSRAYPDLPAVFVTLGDTLRGQLNDADAVIAYTQALALYPENDGALWFVHYVRGISYHRMGDWPLAEADLRQSLAYESERPNVLNFLGYSLVERGERLDEALTMIDRAVAGASQNGAIVDSLGWALFRLGRYADAVPHMEHAASLLPTDPTINDHLGDVYWAVGRTREAAFQWSRALSFDPEPALAERIRAKLDLGLDAVLASEGAPPLVQVADTDG